MALQDDNANLPVSNRPETILSVTIASLVSIVRCYTERTRLMVDTRSLRSSPLVYGCMSGIERDYAAGTIYSSSSPAFRPLWAQASRA